MKLPQLPWKQIARVLIELGYAPSRQRGDHINFVKHGQRTVTVQKINRISPGNLMSIIRQTGLDKQDFLKRLPHSSRK